MSREKIKYMDNPDLKDKCYRTKDDRLHSTIFYRGDLSSETEKERIERLKIIRENRGTWVYDETKKEVVRIEDYNPPKKEVEVAEVSRWNPEWTVISTGKRMSKGELKRYCKENGKVWGNA